MLCGGGRNIWPTYHVTPRRTAVAADVAEAVGGGGAQVARGASSGDGRRRKRRGVVRFDFDNHLTDRRSVGHDMARLRRLPREIAQCTTFDSKCG